VMKARSMRISGKLPHDLWVEIVNTAIYLHNRTPRADFRWVSPYERFYGWLTDNREMSGRSRPQLAHLKAYGCKAYAMTADAKLKNKRLQKLNPRAHIGYLVGYDSTNIFRIWIPHQGKVISSRDVIFDEDEFFDGKKVDLNDNLAMTLDEYVHQVHLPEQASRNEVILQEDDEIVDWDLRGSDQPDGLSDDGEQLEIDEDQETWTSDRKENDCYMDLEETIWTSGQKPESRMDLEPDQETIWTSDRKENESRMDLPALLQADPTPPPSENSALENFIGLAVKNFPVSVQFEGVKESDNIKSDSPNRAEFDENRFTDFKETKIAMAWQGAFLKGRKFKAHKRDLPPPPENYRQLEQHPLRKAFEEAQRQHLQDHTRKSSWQVVERQQAKGHQILSSMWVFVYKTDKHGFLVKCKARLVICGNQQKLGDLPTRATTLASNTLRTLLAISAKFDLELNR
jgi:hypothetical protein